MAHVLLAVAVAVAVAVATVAGGVQAHAGAPHRRVAPRTAHLLAARTSHETAADGESEFTFTPALGAAAAYYASHRGGCPADGIFRTGTARFEPAGGITADLSHEPHSGGFDPAHASRIFNFGSTNVPRPVPGATGILTVRSQLDNNSPREALFIYAYDCERGMPAITALADVDGTICNQATRTVVLSADDLAALTASGDLALLAHVNAEVDSTSCDDFIELELSYPCLHRELPGREPPLPALGACDRHTPSAPFERAVINTPDDRVAHYVGELSGTRPAPFVALDFGAVPRPADFATTATLRIDMFGHSGDTDAYLVLYNAHGCEANATSLELVGTFFAGVDDEGCDSYSETVELDAALLRELTATGRLRLLALNMSGVASDTEAGACNAEDDPQHYVRATISYSGCGSAADAQALVCDSLQ